jgi:hypothetical protein
MNYSIFRSRTFYTLAFTFAYNVWQLLMPSIPTEYSAVIDFALMTIASYYHVDGVKNAAVASATLGQAVSGQ